jgi:hypothetical protein
MDFGWQERAVSEMLQLSRGYDVKTNDFNNVNCGHEI